MGRPSCLQVKKIKMVTDMKAEASSIDQIRVCCAYIPSAQLGEDALGSFKIYYAYRDRDGIVVEHQTPNREVLGFIPTGSTMLCP